MRTGRVTQTIWNRSVKKQIQKGNRNSTGKTAWEESSSELISDEKDFVWSSTSVSGKAPAQVKYAVIKSAGDLAAKRVRPTAVSVQILFPESSDEQELKDIMRILTEICEETGLAIACVQAESVEYVLRTVIQITAVGVKENSKQQMKKWFPGTEIILCGYTGLEGTGRGRSSYKIYTIFYRKNKALQGITYTSRTDFKASGRSEEQTVWGWRCTLRIMGTCRGRKDRV